MKNLLALGAAITVATTGQVFAAQAAGTAGNPIFLINEIRIDEDGVDANEFFEILSVPSNTPLDGLTYIVLGDSTGGLSGTIESVTDLTGASTGADGLFVAAESTFMIGTADLVTTLNFENEDNVTHLLVQGFTGSNGDDLDTDDDGVLDVLPWAAIVDAVSLVDTTDPMAGERFYAGSLGFTDLGPDGSTTPEHSFRCLTSLTDWRIGATSPVGGSDTSGMFNMPCIGVTALFCDPGAANSVSASGGKMGFMGSFSFQRNSTTLTCTDVPDAFGLFVSSDMEMPPFTTAIGGNLCLGGNLVRLNQVLLGVGNQVSLQLDISDMALNEFGTIAGSTRYYQYFHRDSATAGGGNFSNGLRATWTL